MSAEFAKIALMAASSLLRPSQTRSLYAREGKSCEIFFSEVGIRILPQPRILPIVTAKFVSIANLGENTRCLYHSFAKPFIRSVCGKQLSYGLLPGSQGDTVNIRATNQPMQTIAVTDLRHLMTDVFAAFEVSPEDVEMVVDALMEASLSGYDSHGVMRVPRYVDELRRGVTVARGEFQILKETVSSAYVDAGHALGAVTATRALQLACEKAAGAGIGCVSTKNSSDIGRLGSYLWQPAKHGYLTLLMVNDSGGMPSVAPFGGAARFFSTNPCAAGIPRGEEEPIIIDMSTSMTSAGRLKLEARRDASIPDGWLLNQRGESVVEPSSFFENPEDVFLLPLGGMLAGHKGFALQLLIDVIAGALGGAGVATGTDPGIEANAIFALAIDPEHFASRETFTRMVNELVVGLKHVKPLPGFDEVRVPGERAARERRMRQAAGIPLHTATRDELRTVLAGLGLTDKYGEILNLRK
jgi:LDH2 family malate/lactate/ureidoglycolate dehydrogenase